MDFDHFELRTCKMESCENLPVSLANDSTVTVIAVAHELEIQLFLVSLRDKGHEYKPLLLSLSKRLLGF